VSLRQRRNRRIAVGLSFLVVTAAAEAVTATYFIELSPVFVMPFNVLLGVVVALWAQE
jgi:hypothetical protein